MNNSLPNLICRSWRQLVAFALGFRLVESLFLAPLAGWVGQWLLGRTVLDSTAVVPFLLSPRGFTALVLAAIAALGLRLFEHAGLSAIMLGAMMDRKVSAREAWRLLRRRSWALLGVSARFVGAGLLTSLPLATVVGLLSAYLLRQHDVNYYLKLRPPEFTAAVVTIVAVAVVTLGVAGVLLVRWRWAVQVALFEERTSGEALAASARLTRGRRWSLAGAVVGVALFTTALGLLGSVLGGASTSAVLAVLGGRTLSLALSFGLLLVLRTFIGAACTFLGAAVEAGLFTSLYRRQRLESGVELSLPDGNESEVGRTPRWLPWAVATGLIGVTLLAMWLAVGALSAARPTTIHAHRGVASATVPENTLAAVRAAIAAGADYVETDVQLSRDGVLVVVHDSDFSRLGGVPRKVWELTYDEIRAIPLRNPGVPGAPPEYTPTLEALLTEARGRIRVNLELKYYGDHQPDLARKVIEAVRAHGMLEQVVIQCLEYQPLLEVRQLAPEMPVGYLLSFNAREPARLEVDFLSVEQSRVNRAFLAAAHRRGLLVYAWTVNRSEDLERLFDLGIDGVITDESALARRRLEAHQDRPPSERATRRVWAWLAD